ncbi:MAG: hypothetical protein HQL56_04505 [Magnetococcales bacterium]|nr:hypothetical protein [Magnetococcales bacterium]
MKNPSMGPGEWIIVGGLVALLGLLIAALFPESFRSTPVVDAAPAASQPVSNALLTPPGQEALRMIPVAAPARPADGGGTQNGLVLLQQAPRVTFRGKVQQLSEQPQSDGQLHVWLTDPVGGETRISVGPGWFLKYLGCPLAHDIFLEGSGFTFEKGGRSPLVYAKRIRMNGKICELRNDEGFALWSNKLQ